MALPPSVGTTGTSTFNPALADLVLEAFARIQVKSASLTAEHTFQAHMSANLALAEWSSRAGPNLWKVQLMSLPLQQGVSQYSLPSNVMTVLDYYVRRFSIGTPANYAPAFTTTAASAAVSVQLTNHGYTAGEWFEIGVPVAVGGIIFSGFYQVTSVTDVNDFTFTAASPAITSATGGAVPSFTTNQGSTTVVVNLPNNGLGVGAAFDVQVSTLVGGITLFGSYPVAAVVDSNNFTIIAPNAATTTASVSENGGLTQLASQQPDVDPQDYVIMPISRSEYSQIPDKFTQALPTSVWFDRLTIPQVNIWPVPDQNGPYTLYYYAMVQIQDALMTNGATVDMPNRFFEAFAAELTARLAVKYAPALAEARRADAERAWLIASARDTEDVPLYIVPGIGGYSR